MSSPILYRQKEIERIYNIIQTGESCAIVGIGSVGKSNLMRNFARDEVRQAILGDQWLRYTFVYLDRNKILEISTFGLVELMLHQILQELALREINPEIIQGIEAAYKQAVIPADRFLAPRALDRAVSLVCNKLGNSIVFLFDEFDELCAKLPAHTFSLLRALRDDYKHKLSYVTATRLQVNRLRENPAEIEAFEELVTPNTVWLSVFSESDARNMLLELEQRHHLQIGEERLEKYIRMCGFHPGFLRAAFHAFTENPDIPVENLNQETRIQEECQRLWNSLSSEEQKALTSLVANKLGEIPDRYLYQLSAKGILIESCKAYIVFSPIFHQYIWQTRPVIGAHITLNHANHTVIRDGVPISNITMQEYRLMEFFTNRRKQMCSLQEIAEAIFPEDKLTNDGVDDNRIQAAIRRLREKLEPDPDRPQFLITKPKHGYILMDGDEPDEDSD